MFECNKLKHCSHSHMHLCQPVFSQSQPFQTCLWSDVNAQVRVHVSPPPLRLAIISSVYICKFLIINIIVKTSV
jgi:hypothetical protein